jgi:peptidoglycan hydrolase CwlO-like protein
MGKNSTGTEDVLEIIGDLTAMVGEGFDKLEKGQAETNTRLYALEKGQAETNQRLNNVEDKLEAIQADIKELYKMITDLRKDIDENKLHWIQLEKRVSTVEAFATMISKKTGVKFP